MEKQTPASLWGKHQCHIIKYCAEREEGIIVTMDDKPLLHICNFLKFSIAFFYGEYFFLMLI